jgi:hypothetical protein
LPESALREMKSPCVMPIRAIDRKLLAGIGVFHLCPAAWGRNGKAARNTPMAGTTPALGAEHRFIMLPGARTRPAEIVGMSLPDSVIAR